MTEWDKDYNNVGSICVTLYMPGYDADHRDQYLSFPPDTIKRYLKEIKGISDGLLSDGDEEFMIGINSDSLQIDRHKHNLFLEWDNEYGLPEFKGLIELDGVISETQNGVHFIKEDNLSLDELIAEQRDWGCCHGFISSTKKKGFACLRMSPKPEGNVIKIANYHDGLLYSIYKGFVKELGKTNGK